METGDQLQTRYISIKSIDLARMRHRKHCKFTNQNFTHEPPGHLRSHACFRSWTHVSLLLFSFELFQMHIPVQFRINSCIASPICEDYRWELLFSTCLSQAILSLITMCMTLRQQRWHNSLLLHSIIITSSCTFPLPFFFFISGFLSRLFPFFTLSIPSESNAAPPPAHPPHPQHFQYTTTRRIPHNTRHLPLPPLRQNQCTTLPHIHWFPRTNHNATFKGVDWEWSRVYTCSVEWYTRCKGGGSGRSRERGNGRAERRANTERNGKWMYTWMD